MLKKAFIYLFCLCGLVQTAAAKCDVEIIDNSLYEQVLQKSGVSEGDIGLYKRIFKALRKNDPEQADKLIAKLEGKALLGHVLAQKSINTSYVTR